MLTLQQYGVTLQRLTEEDIELVRYWRNQADIANYMEYRNYITEEAQKIWFKKINNSRNYYFIIIYEEKKIGLINVKEYNPTAGYGEGGIFIWNKDYIETPAAVYATLCLLNFIFIELDIANISRARILRNNPRAIYYNKLIGYKLLPGQEDVENQLYELTREDYLKFGSKLNKAAAALNEQDAELRFSGTVCTENLEEINRLLARKIA
jgi:RimJ/RimL family protein N-acetyltransferase